MKKTFSYKIAIAVLSAIAFLAPACKTTEANYRSAYDKAIAGRDSATAIDQTIYGTHRRSIGSRVAITAGGDTAEVRTQFVSVTEGGGGSKENMHPYNVVVGQFKQQFNAKSMRQRLADAGYLQAFVVQNGEPYYYVILSSYETEAEAIKALNSIPQKFPITLRSPLPFILHNPMKR